MTFILIKAGKRAQVIEHEGELDYTVIKEYLEIDTPVDVVERKIGDKYYDLWVDDMGLLKNQERIVGGVLNADESVEFLVGNIVVLNHDDEGNITTLNDEDIENILDNVVNMDLFKAYQGKHNFNEDEKICGYFDDESLVLKAHSDVLTYEL